MRSNLSKTLETKAEKSQLSERDVRLLLVVCAELVQLLRERNRQD